MIRMASVRNTVDSIFFCLLLATAVSVAESLHMATTGCSSASSGHSGVTSFEQGWPILQQAVDKLINMFEGFDNQTAFTSNDYMRYYTVVYELCTARDSEDQRLYEQYKKVFEEYIASKVLPSLRSKKGNDFLQELIKRWSNHKTMTMWLSRFFNYINRYYITRRGLPSLTEASFLSFYETVYGEMNDKVIGAVLSMALTSFSFSPCFCDFLISDISSPCLCLFFSCLCLTGIVLAMDDGNACNCGSRCCPHVAVKLKKALAYRLMMPRDGFPGLETCLCTPSTPAIIRTIWTGNNKGRRMLKCPKPPEEACSFTLWLDGPITGRALAVIDFLYTAVEQLVLEKVADESVMKSLEDEYEKLRTTVFGPDCGEGPSGSNQN